MSTVTSNLPGQQISNWVFTAKLHAKHAHVHSTRKPCAARARCVPEPLCRYLRGKSERERKRRKIPACFRCAASRDTHNRPLSPLKKKLPSLSLLPSLYLNPKVPLLARCALLRPVTWNCDVIDCWLLWRRFSTAALRLVCITATASMPRKGGRRMEILLPHSLPCEVDNILISQRGKKYQTVLLPVLFLFCCVSVLVFSALRLLFFFSLFSYIISADFSTTVSQWCQPPSCNSGIVFRS